jgi:multicomponent Na+:H+ antiporter subunit E
VQGSDRHIVFRPMQAIRFVATFVGLLVVSTASMVRLVLTSRAATAQGVLIEYELAPASYPVRTLIAHSVSLTPGTLTVDVAPDGRTLTIHVIEERDVPQARTAIAGLEQRAAAAFAPRVARKPDTEHPLEVT